MTENELGDYDALALYKSRDYLGNMEGDTEEFMLDSLRSVVETRECAL